MRDEEYVLILGTLLFLVLTAFIVVFITLYRKARLKLVIDRQRFRQEILQAEVEIRENTLREVGRDLHDNLGQIASLVRINLAGLAETSEGNRHLVNSLDLMDRLIREMRELSHSLSDGNRLYRGLNGQIEADLERLGSINGLTIASDISLKEGTLDAEREILLYRIFQEAMSNALKHAEASLIRIVLTEKDDTLVMEVSDNGKGIPPNQGVGKGLTNMKTRAEIMGGTLHLDGKEADGTHIAVTLPKYKIQ